MATNKKATISNQMQNIISQMESLSSCEGTKISFGQYHLNDEDSVKPISWYVLKDDGEYLLLISEFCIDSLPMDLITEYKSDTKWSNCSLRDWLNKEFLENAFSESEKRRIKKYEYKETTIEYVRPSYKRVERSIGMCDRVFLLSAEEIKKYFKFNDQRIKGIPTEYAKKNNMKIVEGFRLRDIMGHATVIGEGVDQVNFSKLVTLNESATFLWKQVEGKEFDEEMLANLLIGEYGIDFELAFKDAKAISEKWIETGLVK